MFYKDRSFSLIFSHVSIRVYISKIAVSTIPAGVSNILYSKAKCICNTLTIIDGPVSNVMNILVFSASFGITYVKIETKKIPLLGKEGNYLTYAAMSNFHCRNIIIGKFLLIGTAFQIFQILTMFTIMHQMNNPLLYLISIEVFIILPLTTFLMGSVVLLISTILQDEKISDFVSMLLSLFIGSAALSTYLYSNAILNLYIYLIYVITIVLINIRVTLLLNKIVE